MKAEKRPTWRKMISSQREAMESIPDAVAGAAIKAAFRYFDGEEVDQGSIEPMAYTAFCLIKPFIDRTLDEYRGKVEAGRKGAIAQWIEKV